MALEMGITLVMSLHTRWDPLVKGTQSDGNKVALLELEKTLSMPTAKTLWEELPGPVEPILVTKGGTRV